MNVARVAALLVLGLVTSAPAQAQSRQPVRVLAGFPPGGNVDILARIFAERLSEASGGRPVIVINKPGAGGQIAAELLKEAPPDGDTLMLAPDAVVIVRPLTMSKPPYDPVADFAPVAQTGTQDYAIALTRKIPPKTLKEFAAWAKANPDGANFGSAGEGGTTHFLGLLIGEAIGTPLRQVPFGGSGPAVNALVAGEISAAVQPLGTVVAQAQAETIRIVAVSGPTRNATFPDAPSLVELGYPALQATSWFGIFAPAKTPRDAVARLNQVFVAAMRTERVRDQMRNLLLDIKEMTPDQLAEVVKAETARWRPIIKASGFTVEVH
ncbi:MAG TPA: tripartite tricarboxylate transporter substrate-binding protein [Alphaproteobacteria bacterium]